MALLLIVALLLGALAAPAAAHTADATVPPPAGLLAGESAFWSGPTIASGRVRDASLCGAAAECPTFPLRLREGGKRLRVAIDTPMRDDTFRVEVLDPSGAVAGTATNSNQFNAEAFIADPKPGTWTVRVLPQDVSSASFRLRAKLERRIPPLPEGKVAVLPDLKAVPPYEFTFVAPANPANGLYPPDTVNPPLDVAGVHPLSCTADEMAPADSPVYGGAATRCLRFTSGPINLGVGPFDMRFSFTEDNLSGAMDPIGKGPMFQMLHFADGSTQLRRAGTYSFHYTHAHFHDDHVLDYQLFRFDPAHPRKLVKAGAGTKSGFCPANQLFGDWRSFTQLAPDDVLGSGDSGAGNCQSFTDGLLGLSPGWGDVYRWQRPGQYVEFGTNGDGRYVVRATVDIENQILETSDADNSAYALVQVTGDRVQLLERGQGSGPFDPHRTVFRGAGPASRD